MQWGQRTLVRLQTIHDCAVFVRGLFGPSRTKKFAGAMRRIHDFLRPSQRMGVWLPCFRQQRQMRLQRNAVGGIGVGAPHVFKSGRFHAKERFHDCTNWGRAVGDRHLFGVSGLHGNDGYVVLGDVVAPVHCVCVVASLCVCTNVLVFLFSFFLSLVCGDCDDDDD